MRNDILTQAQIIEELADRVASFIDQGKPVAFDGALEELIRYHRFVLGLNASTSAEGEPFNYAEVVGNGWNSPLQEWLNQYRRLFERATNAIVETDHFLVALAYHQARLLRLPEDLPASKGLTEAVLDLYPSMIYVLETWVTRRALEQETLEDGVVRQVLAGSDARAHAKVLRDLIGAWESIFTDSNLVSALERSQGKSDEEIWRGYQQAWPFTWRHLINSARSLALAVWNDDEAGAALLREALVRWPENIRYRLPGAVGLRLPELLLPDLIDLDWVTAKDRVSRLCMPYSPEVRPGELFAAILYQVHDDILQLMASLLTFWSLSQKRPGGGPVRTAAEILAREGADDHGQAPEAVSSGALLLEFLRLQLVGERYQTGTYGARLDGLIQSLDGITEREVVSGRVFQPSTVTDREATIWADTAILAAFIDNTEANLLEQRLKELVEAEPLLPAGDRSLRDVLNELDRYLETIELKPQQVLNTIGLFGSDTTEAQLEELGSLVRRARKIVAQYRGQRLLERPVDPDKLEERRAAVEAALFDTSNLSFFPNASIEKQADQLAEIRLFAQAIAKSRLTNPTMGAEIDGEVRAIANHAAASANARAIPAFFGLPHTYVEIDATPLEKGFWEAIWPLAAQVGVAPRLVVPRRFQAPLIGMMFRQSESELAGLKLERLAPRRAGYLCTIEGIDLHPESPDEVTCWLFSGELLKRILYSPVEGDRLVTVNYEPMGEGADAINGVLEFRYRQSFEWSETPIFKIGLPPAPNNEGELEIPHEATIPPEPVARPIRRVRRRIRPPKQKP